MWMWFLFRARLGTDGHQSPYADYIVVRDNILIYMSICTSDNTKPLTIIHKNCTFWLIKWSYNEYTLTLANLGGYEQFHLPYLTALFRSISLFSAFFRPKQHGFGRCNEAKELTVVIETWLLFLLHWNSNQWNLVNIGNAEKCSMVFCVDNREDLIFYDNI